MSMENCKRLEWHLSFNDCSECVAQCVFPMCWLLLLGRRIGTTKGRVFPLIPLDKAISKNSQGSDTESPTLCNARTLRFSFRHCEPDMCLKKSMLDISCGHSIPNSPFFSYSSVPRPAFLGPPRRTKLQNNTLGK